MKLQVIVMTIWVSYVTMALQDALFSVVRNSPLLAMIQQYIITLK